MSWLSDRSVIGWGSEFGVSLGEAGFEERFVGKSSPLACRWESVEGFSLATD
jgi:hypothetical protein